MKREVLLCILGLLFLVNFVSAQSVTANTTYTVNETRDVNTAVGILFVADGNVTLTKIVRSPISTAPFCLVFDGVTNQTMVNSTWVNNTCTANVDFTPGRLYRIAVGANATTDYRVTYNQTYSIVGNGTGVGLLKYYPGIGNFTGGCFGIDCGEFYTIASTMYNIINLTFNNTVFPPPSENLTNATFENVTARLIYTQNFSAEGVTKNLTFFLNNVLSFRSPAQSIWSPGPSILNIATTILALKTSTVNFGNGSTSTISLNFDSSSLDGNLTWDGTRGFIIKSPVTNATGNTTIDQMLKLGVVNLPICNAATNGSIARNVTGLLEYCDGSTWKKFRLM